MALFVRRALAAAGLVVCLPAAAPAQESVTITGRVTSDAGPPLALADVSTAASGEPGAGSYITIRGQRTVGLPSSGSAQPLFVVDGVPIDNTSFSTTDFNPVDGLTAGSIEGTTQTNRASDINPGDIESVEILKGAAAAAIYGSRAGQGVVLITTKHDTPGPTRYTFRSSISADDITRTYPLQRSWGQGSLGFVPSDPALGAVGCDR